ncbi:MAG: hypothetical protein HYU27_01480 [Acidobacteria bacterium]|nr:hypothetical protein [Acidobacteriota bacterium]
MRVLIGLLIALFGAVPQSPAPGEADGILAQLSKIRLDKKQIHSIRDVTIRRDVLSISLTRGVIVFLEPVMGKVTGAVFIGSGEVVAIPPTAIEKQQIYKFTGSPVLNEPFRAAVFRFTDGTYEEISREIALHAHEEVSEEDAAQFAQWDSIIAGRSGVLNSRILADFVNTERRPLFVAELDAEKTGRFNVAVDYQVPEEVTIFKIQDLGIGSVADLWASFNQRSEARNPEAVAHEKKASFDIVSYDIDATIVSENQIDVKAAMRLKGISGGQRVLSFGLSSDLRISAVSLDNGEAAAFYQNANAVTIVLPMPLNAGDEITLRAHYAGSLGDRRSWYPNAGAGDRAVFNVTFHNDGPATLVATPKAGGDLPAFGFVVGSNLSIVPPEGGPSGMLSYFSEMMGPYPYPSISVVKVPRNESRNWPGLIELPSNQDDAKTELVMAQEIARQWLGHKAAPASYHDQWLFEALPRYLGAMYVESKHSGAGRLPEILDDARESLLDVESAGPIWLGQRLANTVTPAGYRAVYTKGVWVLHMLRMLMRQDAANPDARFVQLMKDLVETYGGKTVSTWDFRSAAEKHMGMKLDWFFDDWVFGTGIPAYTLDYQVQPSQNGFVVEGTVKQSGVPDGFTMPVPIYADDELLGRVAVGENEVEFRFRATKKPERVIIDPLRTILTSSR